MPPFSAPAALAPNTTAPACAARTASLGADKWLPPANPSGVTAATPSLVAKPAWPCQRLLGPAVVLLAWFIVTQAQWVAPETLPSLSTIAQTFVELSHDDYLYNNVLASLERAGLGLLIGTASGAGLALVAGLTRPGDAMIDGLVQIKRAIPNLALIPLFIMWLGIGETMKITVIALGVMVPIYINTHAALREIDRRHVELATTLGLNYRHFLRYVVLPGSLPGFITGLRLGSTHAWTALVVVETINATAGIGYMISQARIYGQIEVVMAGLVLYGVLGFGTDSLIRQVQRRALDWRQTLAP